MLGLHFQNPEMMFFTSFEEKQCPVCLTMTTAFFMLSASSPLCLDCFDTFFIKFNTKKSSAGGEHKDYGGQDEVF